MFAFALYDRENNSLYLGRDRCGEKPLFYAYDENGVLFSSELKGILAYPGITRDINYDVISSFLLHGYIDAPYSIFRSIEKIRPGEIVQISNKDIKRWKYWDISQIYKEYSTKLITNAIDAKKGLKDLIKDSVRNQLVADVPVGVLLSGGIDSTLVAAVAKEQSCSQVKTFTIGFCEDEYNEAAYAKRISDHLNTNHTDIICTEKELLALIDDIPYYYDEPFSDSSQIPTMLVSGLASKEVKVVLSGDGGDELFGGYKHYRTVDLSEKLDTIGRLLNILPNILEWKNSLPSKVKMVIRNHDYRFKSQIQDLNYIDLIHSITKEETAIERIRFDESTYGVKDWVIRRMLLDLDSFLSNGLMTKSDRASMKYSIEYRCPLLDKDIISYSFRLNNSYKYSNGEFKKILKEIVYDYVPKSLLDRPKMGFSIPLDKWLKTALKGELIDFSNKEYLVKQGIFDADEIIKNLNEYINNNTMNKIDAYIWWNYMIFQKWYYKWCGG